MGRLHRTFKTFAAKIAENESLIAALLGISGRNFRRSCKRYEEGGIEVPRP
jgi:hypothetical protein